MDCDLRYKNGRCRLTKAFHMWFPSMDSSASCYSLSITILLTVICQGKTNGVLYAATNIYPGSTTETLQYHIVWPAQTEQLCLCNSAVYFVGLSHRSDVTSVLDYSLRDGGVLVCCLHIRSQSTCLNSL